MKKYEMNDQTCSDFFRQLSMLLHSGLRLDDACSVLASEETEKEYREILTKIAAALENGSPLYAALSQAAFLPADVIALIQTAENSGRTEEVLAALANTYENKARMRRNLINSISYPLILLVIMLVIVVVLLSEVFPIFSEVYASLGSSLTGMAAALLKVGSFIGAALPYLGILFGVAMAVLASILLLPKWKACVKRWFLRFFGDRGIMKKSNDAFFVQNLAMIQASGVPLAQGLHLAEDLLKEQNVFYRRYQEAQNRIQNGENFPEVLKDLKFIDLAAYRMLSVAERTGNTDAVMEKLADQMASAAEDAMEEQISHMEMAIVIVMSFLVGAILFSAMLPLINIMKSFG